MRAHDFVILLLFALFLLEHVHPSDFPCSLDWLKYSDYHANLGEFEYTGSSGGPPTPEDSPEPLPDVEDLFRDTFQDRAGARQARCIDLTGESDTDLPNEPLVPLASTSRLPPPAIPGPAFPIDPIPDQEPCYVVDPEATKPLDNLPGPVPPYRHLRHSLGNVERLEPFMTRSQCQASGYGFELDIPIPVSNYCASPLGNRYVSLRAYDEDTQLPNIDSSCAVYDAPVAGTSQLKSSAAKGKQRATPSCFQSNGDAGPEAKRDQPHATSGGAILSRQTPQTTLRDDPQRSSTKQPCSTGFDSPFADPTQVGSGRRKGKRPRYAEPSEVENSEDGNAQVTVWVSRRFYWFETKPLTPAQAARPESRRPPRRSYWQARPSSLDDVGPGRSFRLNLADATPAGFRQRALELLEIQRPGAVAYMNSNNPAFTTTLYGTIMVMTRATGRLPARRRIKAQYNITDNRAWAAFIAELEVLDVGKAWAGAFWDMSNPEQANAIPAADHLEATNLAQWQAQNQAPGPAPAPVVPQLTDDRAYSKLALALKRRYSRNGLGSGDNMIVAHPTRPNWQMNLTPKRLHLWVQHQMAATLDGREGIDIDNPPRGPDFRWSLHGIEQSEGTEAPPAAAIHSSAATVQQNAHSTLLSNVVCPQQPNAVASSSNIPIDTRPDPLDRRMYLPKFCGSMNDFLTYALVHPDDQRTRKALTTAGFNNWASLQEGAGVSTEALIGHGILPGIAGSLIRFARDFAVHVQNCINHGGFFQPEE